MPVRRKNTISFRLTGVFRISLGFQLVIFQTVTLRIFLEAAPICR